MPEPLRLKALHHAALATTRPEQTLAFYRDVLGFRELPRPPFSFRGAWLYNCGLQIHLIESPDHAPAPGGPIDTRANHLAFAVADLAQVKRTLEAHGVPYRETRNAGGVQQIFLHDPDGHHVELAVYGDPAVGYTAPAVS